MKSVAYKLRLDADCFGKRGEAPPSLFLVRVNWLGKTAYNNMGVHGCHCGSRGIEPSRPFQCRSVKSSIRAVQGLSSSRFVSSSVWISSLSKMFSDANAVFPIK